MDDKNKLLLEVLGWYGMVAILLAYGLISFSFITSDSFIYHILNLTGAIGILVISVAKKAYQPAALNVVWSFIAIVALLRIFL